MTDRKILEWLGTLTSAYNTQLDKTDHEHIQITLTRNLAQEFVENVEELQKELNRLYKVEQAIKDHPITMQSLLMAKAFSELNDLFDITVYDNGEKRVSVYSDSDKYAVVKEVNNEQYDLFQLLGRGGDEWLILTKYQDL